MLRSAIHEVIPRLWADQPMIQARETVNLINEAVGALRVGESCNGGGEGYGLDANNTMIVTNAQTGEVTMEVYLKCSKTHLGRWVDMADVTLGSGVRVVDAYRTLYRVNGLTVTPPLSTGGFFVEQPDSWSVKLSLLTLTPDHGPQLARLLTEFVVFDPTVTRKVGTMLKYFRDRVDSKKNVEAHSYLLLNEGQHSSPQHAWLMAALERHGLGRIGSSVNLVPAPLLRSTCNGGYGLLPMPFLATSTYDNMGRIFRESFALANPAGDPDPDLDLQGHAAPRLNNHSWRRYADRIASRHGAFHGCSKGDVDLYCGWNLKEHERDMQEHYAGEDHR